MTLEPQADKVGTVPQVFAVAKKAGISKVTVYSRHSNRDDLICAVIRSQAEAFTANLPLPQTSLDDARAVLELEPHKLQLRGLCRVHRIVDRGEDSESRLHRRSGRRPSGARTPCTA